MPLLMFSYNGVVQVLKVYLGALLVHTELLSSPCWESAFDGERYVMDQMNGELGSREIGSVIE